MVGYGRQMYERFGDLRSAARRSGRPGDEIHVRGPHPSSFASYRLLRLDRRSTITTLAKLASSDNVQEAESGIVTPLVR
jgi:hypothetical protein